MAWVTEVGSELPLKSFYEKHVFITHGVRYKPISKTAFLKNSLKEQCLASFFFKVKFFSNFQVLFNKD